MTGVSATSVQRAVGVLNASPELHAEMHAGTTTLHQATQAVKRKKTVKKASLMDKDEAQQKILEICGERFWSAVMAKKVSGLKSGNEQATFADRPAAELRVLAGIMFWGELTLAEALQFRKDRFGKKLSKKWKLEDLMAFMGEENRFAESFVTIDREFAYTVTIERFLPKKPRKAQRSGSSNHDSDETES